MRHVQVEPVTELPPCPGQEGAGASSGGTNTGAIVGGVVGGLAAVTCKRAWRACMHRWPHVWCPAAAARCNDAAWLEAGLLSCLPNVCPLSHTWRLPALPRCACSGPSGRSLVLSQAPAAAGGC